MPHPAIRMRFGALRPIATFGKSKCYVALFESGQSRRWILGLTHEVDGVTRELPKVSIGCNIIRWPSHAIIDDWPNLPKARYRKLSM